MSRSSLRAWVDRFLLPGFAFKAVVIGGGYATGRELAEFFLPSGPRGGLLGMGLAALLWSVLCALTFEFARTHLAFDYRAFFRQLLGPFWPLFEIAYVLLLILILAVFGAAAGEIGHALLQWPLWGGSACLMLAIAAVVAYGNRAVERLFTWVTVVLYGVYALLVLLSFSHFGERIAAALRESPTDTPWLLNGTLYAGYNLVGAVVILPVLRHLTCRRDALVAGFIAGPLAMLPALLFFTCMLAFYPEITQATLPSDYLLQRLDLPWFHGLFQAMIFCALLESGSGAVHAINERIAMTFAPRTRRPFDARARLGVAAVLLLGSMVVADRVGLVALIAHGYRAIAFVFFALYVLPLVARAAWHGFVRRRPRITGERP